MIRRAAGVHRPQRPGQPAGSLGRGSRLFAVHARRPRSRRCSSPPTPPMRTARPASRRYLRETADTWYASLDDWMYVTDTELARQCGVDGYYVRVAEPDEADAASPKDGFVPIKNRPPADSSARAGADGQPGRARAGALRPARRRRSAHRQHGEGDRRAAEGRDAERSGVAPLQRRRVRRARRRQPVRRHRHRPAVAAADRRARALRAGRRDAPDAPSELARAMQAFAGESQLLPEQVWDAADIPERELFAGRRHRIGAAAGLGARGVRQAAAIDSGRRRLRSAAADRRALRDAATAACRCGSRSGASTTRSAAMPTAASCASRRWRRRWCTSASTTGSRRRTSTRSTPVSASGSRTSTPRRFRARDARRFHVLLAGRRALGRRGFPSPGAHARPVVGRYGRRS